MATYKQIQNHVKETHGYVPKSCWTAHMKEVCGLNPKMSARRHSSESRVHPCPVDKQDHIRKSFQHFKMI
jgi:hypothetical protein